MKTGPVKIEISGPQGSGKGVLAERLKADLSRGGKVVRHYDLGFMKGDLPDPLPTDCHVIIIVRND